MITVQPVSTIKNALGEGPLWDSDTQSLYWVDSLKGKISRLSGNDKVISWSLPCMIGSLAIVNKQSAIVALQTGLHFFNFENSELTPICDPEAEMPETRFNDGKTDRSGNFLVGSMGIKIRDRPIGALYRINPDLEMEVLEPDVIVANGPCFSPDGDTFYFNDGRRRILAYDYDPTGSLQNKRVFFEGEKHNTSSDGATVDTQGNLWVALTGSSEIGCIRPDGKLIERIQMPINLPSSVMFGGNDLKDLYVTSISNSGNRTSNEDGAGGLFRITGTGATGIPEKRFLTTTNTI
jgi:L-arabinonolactonase